MRPRRWRLVARIRTPVVPCSSAAASSAQAGSRCSQLSTRRSSRRSRNRSTSAWSGGRAEWSWRSSASAAASGTSAGSSRPERCTNRTPSGKVRRTAAAMRAARRVLPTPPGPVSVTSRVLARSSRPAASSPRRSTKVVVSTGRWWSRGADPPMISRSSGGVVEGSRNRNAGNQGIGEPEGAPVPACAVAPTAPPGRVRPCAVPHPPPASRRFAPPDHTPGWTFARDRSVRRRHAYTARLIFEWFTPRPTSHS